MNYQFFASLTLQIKCQAVFLLFPLQSANQLFVFLIFVIRFAFCFYRQRVSNCLALPSIRKCKRKGDFKLDRNKEISQEKRLDAQRKETSPMKKGNGETDKGRVAFHNLITPLPCHNQNLDQPKRHSYQAALASVTRAES